MKASHSFSGREQPHLSGSCQKLVHDWPLVHLDDGLLRQPSLRGSVLACPP